MRQQQSPPDTVASVELVLLGVLHLNLPPKEGAKKQCSDHTSRSAWDECSLGLPGAATGRGYLSCIPYAGAYCMRLALNNFPAAGAHCKTFRQQLYRASPVLRQHALVTRGTAQTPGCMRAASSGNAHAFALQAQVVQGNHFRFSCAYWCHTCRSPLKARSFRTSGLDAALHHKHTYT